LKSSYEHAQQLIGFTSLDEHRFMQNATSTRTSNQHKMIR
jgi:hypothetical protein